MAQKAVGQKPVLVTGRKPKKAYFPVHGVISQDVELPSQAAVLEMQKAHDDSLWDEAIANSMAAIRELADKALADRRTGHTKKITL